MCFAWISEPTAIFSLYSINLSVFITEAESVYCAVLKELNRCDSLFEGLHSFVNNFKNQALISLSDHFSYLFSHHIGCNEPYDVRCHCYPKT